MSYVPRSKQILLFCCLLAGKANWFDVVKPSMFHQSPGVVWNRLLLYMMHVEHVGHMPYPSLVFWMSHGIFQKSTKNKNMASTLCLALCISESFQVATGCKLRWSLVPQGPHTVAPDSRMDSASCKPRRCHEKDKSWWKPSRTTNTASISPCHFSTCQTQNQVPSISFCRLAIRSSRVSTCAEQMDWPIIDLQVTIPWLLGGTLLRELRQVPRDTDPLSLNE